MKKRPPKQIKTLENLIQQAEHYAEYMMSGSAGTVVATLMALTPEGVLMHVPARMSTEEDKDRFAKVARLIAVGYKASALAMIMEAWIVVPKRRGQKLDMSVPPSQSPDREEVVSIVAESFESCASRFLFIQRDSIGKFTGFGTSLMPDFSDKPEGRFGGIMPPKEPTDEIAASARNLLKAMGIAVESRGFNPELN